MRSIGHNARAGGAALVAAVVCFGAGAGSAAAPSAGAARAGGDTPCAENEGDRAACVRALATLRARELVLANQAATADSVVRVRARALYRVARLASEGGGPGEVLDHGRAITLGAAALDRELSEARLVVAELERARREQAALASPDGPPEPAPSAAPAFVWPASGPVLGAFGPARDSTAGTALLRAGIGLAAPSGAPVVAPGAGRVRRIGTSVSGHAVVVDHGGRWTSIVGGLAEVNVTVGQQVALGEPIGVAARARRGRPTIVVEIWRGRLPVDPTRLLRGRGPARARAGQKG